MELQESGAAMGIMYRDSLPDLQLLMREMTHRISNEFTSAISLVAVTASRCGNEEVKDALAGVREHLEQYARVHHALRMPEPGVPIDASSHLRELCRSVSHSKLSAWNIELVFIDHPMLLASERCWLLALVLYELVTNSARHAFGRSGGQIRVELMERAGIARCIVSDDGAATGGGRRRGGLEIINSLVESLQGTIEQQFGPSGSVSVVTFPLETGFDWKRHR
jgi:two-component sensor histidine kinase